MSESFDLVAEEARHQRNHGPIGCAQPDQCRSAFYLAEIRRLTEALEARAERLAHAEATLAFEREQKNMRHTAWLQSQAELSQARAEAAALRQFCEYVAADDDPVEGCAYADGAKAALRRSEPAS